MPWLIGGYVSWLLKPRTCGDRQTERQADRRCRRRGRSNEIHSDRSQFVVVVVVAAVDKAGYMGSSGRQAAGRGQTASVEPQPHSNM